MKRTFIVLAFLTGVILVSCNSSDQKKMDTDVVNNSNSARGNLKPFEAPKITFAKQEHDFGKIIQGEFVRYSFKFTNTGKSDLVISKVSTSCGCTVGNYPRQAIEPGGEGKIEVIFDSRGRKGFQNKTITVLANSNPNKTILRIKSNVVLPQNK